jgi:hypothetical protein
MIALSINEIIWDELSKDAAFNAKYDKYRVQYGQAFKPFFPVQDNYAGDVAWGNEPYFLYDTVLLPPNRSVFGERYEQMLYTVVGSMSDIQHIYDTVAQMFSFWESNTHTDPFNDYRITNIDAWSPLRTQSRDSLRQNHSFELLVNVNYILCHPSGKI